MDGDRIARVAARIEAAVRRIEVAAGRPSSGAVRQAEDDPELVRKYQALRREAETALTQLDQVIGSIER